MNESKEPAPPNDFDARLAQALERRRERVDGRAKPPGTDVRSGLGIAMRIGIELVAAVMVGAGIGYLLDRWLGTSPGLLIVFVFLGGAAGIVNVVRIAQRLGGTVGYRKGATPPAAARTDEEREDEEEEGR